MGRDAVDPGDAAPNGRRRKHHADLPLADGPHDLAQTRALKVELHQRGSRQHDFENLLQAPNGTGRGEREDRVARPQMDRIDELPGPMKNGTLSEDDSLGLAGAARRVDDEAGVGCRHREGRKLLGHRPVLQRLVEDDGANAGRQQQTGCDVGLSQNDRAQARMAHDRGNAVFGMVPIDHYAGPVRRQAGQHRDGIGRLIRQQNANRRAGRGDGLDRGPEAPACPPYLGVGQLLGKISAGNPVLKLLRGDPEQFEGGLVGEVAGKRAKRIGWPVQIECRNVRI